MDNKSVFDNSASGQRLMCAHKLQAWSICAGSNVGFYPHVKDPRYIYMAKLLGYKHVQDMLDNFTEDSLRKLKLINGPHGLTILKAMEARL